MVPSLWVCKNYLGPSADPLIRFGVCKTKDKVQDDPPNNGNITIYTSFNLIHISKLDEIENTLTAQLRFSMFWMDERVKTNFSHKTVANTSYDILKINIKTYLKNEKTGRSGEGVPIWLPDYNFENQQMRESVTEEFVLTELNI